jgi:bifunctional DNA-binding transcriptional regulator/antitoxin component of YhaV-PrlF toxin-antitoxin module
VGLELGMSESETITTTVQTNKRGDVRIPAEVRRALDFDGQEAILEVTVSCKKVLDDAEKPNSS